MWIHKYRELLFVIGVLIVFAFSSLSLVSNYSFRLDSDYDTVIPYYEYVTTYVRQYHSFPDTFSLAGVGSPIKGNILTSDYNPFFILPVLFLGSELGIRLVFVMTVIASGICMWMMLKRLHLQNFLIVWGALLYALCGALTARFAAGHTLFALTYPVWPLFFTLVIDRSHANINRLGLAAILTYILFSGDLYGVGFGLMFLIIIKGFQFIPYKERNIEFFWDCTLVIFLFFIFSSVRLVPAFTHFFPKVTRYFTSIPTEGSIHPWFIPLSFIIPLRELFFDRPTIQRMLGYHFNWYEYYAFISPLPFLFLVYIKRIWINENAKMFLFIIIVGCLYISLKYPYSPFYYLFTFIPPLAIIHVPQRILMVIVSPLIGLLALCAHERWRYPNKHYEKHIIALVCILSIWWTYRESQKTFLYAFESEKIERRHIVEELRARDSSNFYVASFLCCLQTYLVRSGIPMLNFYQAMRSKDTPDFLNENGKGFNYALLQSVKPTYVIAPHSQDISPYGYAVWLARPIGIIWKTDSPNIFPNAL